MAKKKKQTKPKKQTKAQIKRTQRKQEKRERRKLNRLKQGIRSSIRTTETKRDIQKIHDQRVENIYHGKNSTFFRDALISLNDVSLTIQNVLNTLPPDIAMNVQPTVIWGVTYSVEDFYDYDYEYTMRTSILEQLLEYVEALTYMEQELQLYQNLSDKYDRKAVTESIMMIDRQITDIKRKKLPSVILYNPEIQKDVVNNMKVETLKTISNPSVQKALRGILNK